MKATEPVVGGLYASRAGDGSIRITKVLVVDEYSVHVRMYAERFAQLPAQLASNDLSLGSLFGAGGFGIGHAPMSREAFLAEDRRLVATEAVLEEELEGYRIWSGEDDA